VSVPGSILLGIDGGLAHMGLAVAVVGKDKPTIIWSGVIETVKQSEGTAAADNVRRARIIWDGLDGVVRLHKPVARIVAEAMSHPRDARAAAMLSMSWGVVSAVAAQHGLVVDAASPMTLKRRLTGNQTAKKDEMIQAVRDQYPEVKWMPRRDLHEHQADAVAAVHAFTWGMEVPA
jgi:Holliday junction resolvasome RuvABC endonuclease subunit